MYTTHISVSVTKEQLLPTLTKVQTILESVAEIMF